MPERPALLFVTGAPRTGTTLVQKLLDMQPGISVLAQPLPLLFVEIKRDFLSSLGARAGAEPLGHLFGERRYTPASFAAYLDAARLPARRVRDVVESMLPYSGQYQRLDPATLASTLATLGDSATPFEVLRAFYTRHATQPGARVVGAKEVFCEEFLPFLIRAGFHAILVLREPRDALASMRFGDGRAHAGVRRPLLTDVRRWRKSVAFALDLAGAPGFISLRYEDLVKDPSTALAALGRHLGIPIAYTPGAPVVTAAGEPWAGNSSFETHGNGAITAGSVGVHRLRMPRNEAQLIAALCAPEMRALGYATGYIRRLETAAAGYREDPSTVRPGYDADLLSAASVAAETERLRLLHHPGEADPERYFLSERSRRALAAAL